MRSQLLAACLGLLAAPAAAAGDPDAVRGLLADRCADCHAIPGYSAGTPDTGLPAPSFEVIANDPTVYTEERVRTFLQQPHWPMTGFTLSPTDVDNVLAYLEALRQR